MSAQDKTPCATPITRLAVGIIGMDEHVIEQHLTQAEAHAALGERHVARQRAIVAELERTGLDSTAARELLATFETGLHQHLENCARLRVELESLERERQNKLATGKLGTMGTPRLFELVVNREAVTVHGSLVEAMELATEALPFGDVFIRSVASDPAQRGSDTTDCFYFDPVSREWGHR